MNVNPVIDGGQAIVMAVARVVQPDFSILNLPEDYMMGRAEAAQFSLAMGLPITKSTLAKIHCVSSDGPPVINFGRKVRYRVADFRAWLLERASKPRRSTSQAR